MQSWGQLTCLTVGDILKSKEVHVRKPEMMMKSWGQLTCLTVGDSLSSKEVHVRKPSMINLYIRGRSQTTLTKFCPLLTTNLPRVDICDEFPLLL